MAGIPNAGLPVRWKNPKRPDNSNAISALYRCIHQKSQFVFIAVWPLRIGSSGAISVLTALGGWADTTQKRRETSRRWFVGPVTSNCRLLSRFPGHWLEPRQPRTPATIAPSMAGPGGSRRARAIGCNGRRNVNPLTTAGRTSPLATAGRIKITIIQLPGFK